jgi:glycosyl transferase family 25
VSSVEPSTVTMPPLYVISLDRARDRRAFVEEAFGAVGLSPRIVSAVDGQRLDPGSASQYAELNAVYAFGRPLTPGEIAVALSHLSLYRLMLEEGHDEVVVFEDDVRPSPELVALLAERHRFPSDADVVTLHSLFDWATPVPVDDEVLAGHFRVCRYQRTPMGAQAYLVRARAARRLLEVAYPVRLPSDELLFRPRPARLRVYGIEPTPVEHVDFPSELHGTPAASHQRSWFERIAFTPVRIAGRIDHRVRSRTWHRPR